MDFIFEEDMDDVGSDIEAFCPKCRANTAHTVISKYEDEVRRVQCSPCGDVHAFRKPHGDQEAAANEDEIPEPVAAKKRAAAKKPSWQEAIDRVGHNKANNNARPYSIRDSYKENDIVNHPKFGLGFVAEISDKKVEVTFSDERRVLIHNRPDLAQVMPAIAAIPAPREDKRRGKKGKGAPPPAAKGKPGVKTAPQPPPVVAAAAAAKGGAMVKLPKGVKPPVAAAAAAKPTPVAAAKPTAPAAATAAKPADKKKVERAKAAATKKTAAKGKPAASPAAKKPAAKAPIKTAGKPARLRAVAARAAKPAAKPVKSPAKKKAGKR